jgi:glycosyltransferase involved in cell wall biosynthesis
MSPPPLKVLMLCAHEPTLDPRIRWEAESAAGRAEVTVLGFNRDEETLPECEIVGRYTLVRLTRNEVSGLYYFWRLKDVIPNRVRIPLGVVVVILWPILVPAEILIRLTHGSVCLVIGGASRLISLSPLITALRHSTAAQFARRLTARPRHVIAMLRAQFATATSLFWNYLRDMPEKPDVVHCNDLDTLLVGVLAKRRYGCRVVFDAHEFYPHSDPDGRWLDITFFSLLERFLIRRADAVVTVNPLLAEAMREAYGLERVHAVPNAEPWVEDRPPPLPGSEMERLAAGRVKFLYQGLFTRGRGIDGLVEAWSKVDTTRTALFLRGPDNVWRRQAIQCAARFGLLNCAVFFLDPVTEQQLICAAAEADVGVIPYEPHVINNRLCCPNKLSQYLHAGLMVITNELPYVKSVLADADAGLSYDSSDPDSLAAVIMRIVQDPELLKRSRENALRFARERFNWQAHAQTFDALYHAHDAGGEGGHRILSSPQGSEVVQEGHLVLPRLRP